MTPMRGDGDPPYAAAVTASWQEAGKAHSSQDTFSLRGMLVITSAVAVEQCGLLLPDQPVWRALVAACLWVAGAVAVRLAAQGLLRWLSTFAGEDRQGVSPLRRRWRDAALHLGRATAAVAVVCIAVVVTSLTAGGGGSPEQLLMAVFRGTLLALVVAGAAGGEMLLAITATVFLVTFSAVVVEHPGGWIAETWYAVSAAWLLVSRNRGSGRSPDLAGSSPERLSVPRLPQLAACLAVVLVVAGLGRSTERTGRAIAGFMPFSGGDSWAFPWAHDGVGDGEQLVAATENPQATGPVDSNLFLTSEEPSLYDLFNDLYGEPELPRRRFSPAVALPSDVVSEPETRPAESNHAGRQFSTLRKPPRRPSALCDLSARSLVSVTGPLPVHLRLEVFHDFDGHVWHAATPDPASSSLVHAGDSWMRWQTTREQDGSGSEPDASRQSAGLRPDRHEITIGTLRSETLPLATRTTQLRIDRVEQPGFYEIVDDQMAAMRGVPVPASTTIAVESHAGGIDGSAASLPEDLLPQPAEPNNDIRDTAASERWSRALLAGWGFDIDARRPPTSWDDAQRLVGLLRREYILDADDQPPTTCADSLEHFLTVSQRGPDHLFAGAATLLLRELGYTTRLAGGLWLSSADRDPLTQRAVAQTGNAHLWCELLTTSGQWIPVEASPRHQLRRPPWTWRQLWRMALAAVAAAAGWLLQPAVSGLLLAVVSIAITWRVLADRLLTAAWWLALRQPRRCPLRPTWQLLEWRAWLAGCPRPPHVTARRWYVAACDESAGFITALEERAYAAPAACRDPVEHRRLALAAEAAVSLRTLQAGHGQASATSRRRPWSIVLRGSGLKELLR